MPLARVLRLCPKRLQRQHEEIDARLEDFAWPVVAPQQPKARRCVSRSGVANNRGKSGRLVGRFENRAAPAPSGLAGGFGGRTRDENVRGHEEGREIAYKGSLEPRPKELRCRNSCCRPGVGGERREVHIGHHVIVNIHVRIKRAPF